MKKTNTAKPLNIFQLATIPLVIAAFTYICFSPALKNGFTNWDDNAYVFENTTALSKPLSQAIPYFFSQHYFIGNYIPITMLVYSWEYHTAGLAPHFFHLVNLLLHLANVLLLFWFIYLLSGKKPMVAAIVAFFFALHPMHVESVAWISELKDVLYTLFFIAGLIAYYHYGNQLKLKFILLAFLLFVLSVLAKPAALVFPLVLLLIDYYRARKFNSRTWLEKIPFLVVSIIFGIIAITAQQADRLLHDDYSLIQRFFFASHSLLYYLVKCVAPVNLSIFYPYPDLENGLPLFYYISPLIVAGLCYLVYRFLRHSRVVLFGLLFFFTNLILVLQLVSVGDAVLAERYTYVSYIGLFFVLAMGFNTLYFEQRAEHKTYRSLATFALVFAGIACAYATHERCKVWHNDDTLATDLLNKYPDDRLALNNKGFVLLSQGRQAEAIPLFKRAVTIKKDYNMAYINLINAYLSVSDYDNALITIDTALYHSPAEIDLKIKKAQVLFLRGDYKASIALYQNILQAQKNNVTAYTGLAECYYKMNDYQRALKITDEALSIEPGNYLLLNNKGYMLFVLKRYNEAVPYFEKSLKIRPDYQTASINLQNCYSAMKSSVQ